MLDEKNRGALEEVITLFRHCVAQIIEGVISFRKQSLILADNTKSL